MYNKSFYQISNSDKRNKLKRVILGKNPNIPDRVLDEIVSQLDIEKQYHVKVTSKIDKFKNIITDEFVNTELKKFRSISKSLTGTFKPGIYQNTNGKVFHQDAEVKSNHIAAALKIIEEKDGLSVKKSQMVIIYIPNPIN